MSKILDWMKPEFKDKFKVGRVLLTDEVQRTHPKLCVVLDLIIIVWYAYLFVLALHYIHVILHWIGE